MEILLLSPPPRSRLYNLEPVGIGTPYVECLSGYAARLAEKHSTTPYYLFSREVAPIINKPGTISLRVSFASFSKAVNGLSVIAADLVKVFERLTLHQNLRFTTLLPWLGAISSKSLTRDTRAWCPACYEECAAGEEEVYDQLIWSVQCVTACARHKRRLEHYCQHCGQQQLTLSHRIRPGFCGRCQGWLGRPAGSKGQIKALRLVETTGEELRIAEEVGKLLAAAPNLAFKDTTVNFTENLQGYVGRMFLGRGVPSKIHLPADKETIRCWLRGTQTPSLYPLLKTCLALNISPLDLLPDGRDSSPEFEADLAARGKHLVGCLVDEDILPIDWKNEESVARVEKRLCVALCEDPPASLTKIAKELKCARGTLRKKLPELAADIAKRAYTYYRPSVRDEEILRVLQEALQQNPPLPLEEIPRLLGKGVSAQTLHNKFPKESRMIVERYRASGRRQLDDALIEKRLRAFTEAELPPSMTEVSREIGIARTVIYNKFPALCKVISNRAAIYRRERGRQRKDAVKSEIRSICERAVHEGLYPDASWVRSQLKVPCGAAAFSQFRREALAEMSHAY
jgi:DNA-binding Lrp family transcriptional regulator